MANNNTYLYFIHEAISGLRITNFMEFPNDLVALKSFINFLKEKEGEEHLYTLCKACEIDVNDALHELNKCICHGDRAKILLEKEMEKLNYNDEEEENV